MTTTNQHKVTGVRWGVVERCSDGTLYVSAWNDSENPHGSVVASVTLPAGSSEREVYDTLRDTLCKRYRVPTGTTLVNDRGDVI
jgi:hypothetical protein